MKRDPRRRFSSQLLQRILLSLSAGSFVLVLSNLADWGLAEGLLLSVMVSGIVLLIEFLNDFDGSIQLLKTTLSAGLANFSEATRAYAKAEQSPLDFAVVKRLMERVGGLRTDTQPLLLDLINLELSRMATFLKQVSDAGEGENSTHSGAEQPFSIAYHGEDREWLLGLTSVAKKSIDAISLTTIDGGVTSFDGGLWRSDLGHRYVELQRKARMRDVQIRRIFYFDNPEIKPDRIFIEVCERQKALGVDVRLLLRENVPADLENLVSDYIVFDDGLGYEMTSAVALIDGHRPERMTTYLSARDERVQDLKARFERLWDVAEEADWEELRRSLPPVDREMPGADEV